MEQEKLSFGLVGCGRIGLSHAKQMALRGTLSAVCDTVKERADELATKYSAKAYYSLSEMLRFENDLHLVSVCTPNALHARHSIEVLESGCHVLCEKPMALRVADCELMIRSAEKNDRKLFVVKQNRYNPPVVAVRKLIRDGLLGKLYNLQLSCFWNRNKSYYENTWKGTLELDGGTLFTQFSHFIDLLYLLCGEVKSIEGYTANFAHKGVIEFEDSGVMILHFENQAIASVNYTVNSYRKNMEGSLTIFGELGTVKIGGQYLNELEYQEIENYKIADLPAGSAANNYGFYEGSMSNHHLVFDNVIQVLKGKEDMLTTPLEGLKTVEIICRFYEQAKKVN